MFGMMGFGYLAMVFMALVVIGIVVLIVWAVIHLVESGEQHRLEGRESAREILDRRFAQGEIDHEEYERRRQALDGRH